ncbi:MAG: enoyl-CoA hydratase/isomerase family protein [Firmicutes bacterium]|nr:enoyl-CoA hydratase/isomerase family protein [Bacillota bacterium]
MSFQYLLVEKEAGIGLITINRPEQRNALNREAWAEIRQAVGELGIDDDVQVLVITGAGDKAFVAGADVRALRERSMLQTLVGEYHRVLLDIEELDKPVIAAVNGFCFGGGCELAMACDLRIASENAKFGQPELGLAIMPGAGGTQRLPRLVGLAKAKELILTGEIIDAAEALRIGLVNKVVPAGELMVTVQETAKRIMSKGPVAVRMVKRVMRLGTEVDLRTALNIEILGQAVIFGTEDRLEGLDAFLEKRSPRFQGK